MSRTLASMLEAVAAERDADDLAQGLVTLTTTSRRTVTGWVEYADSDTVGILPARRVRTSGTNITLGTKDFTQHLVTAHIEAWTYCTPADVPSH